MLEHGVHVGQKARIVEGWSLCHLFLVRQYMSAQLIRSTFSLGPAECKRSFLQYPPSSTKFGTVPYLRMFPVHNPIRPLGRRGLPDRAIL